MRRVGRLVLAIPMFGSLAACAPFAAMLGYGAPAIQIAAQIDQIKLVADGISYVGSGKTISDHVISAATGSDCKMTNVLDKAPICVAAKSPDPQAN